MTQMSYRIFLKWLLPETWNNRVEIYVFFWQRYGFWVGWLSVWPALFLATWLYFTFRGW
ncbi:TPA: hypothetical protein G8N97_004424 [Salmonella enterica]|uniref:Uncharacterized protein n=1 Tax=Salmonella enterica TaxID=28901 RepID=A0A750N524_SALER|nr:hypothetical protein [Salmonella enterica]